jgi:hypothetical protein
MVCSTQFAVTERDCADRVVYHLPPWCYLITIKSHAAWQSARDLADKYGAPYFLGLGVSFCEQYYKDERVHYYQGLPHYILAESLRPQLELRVHSTQQTWPPSKIKHVGHCSSALAL